ncbi:MAG TPA: type II secretion system protein N [Usitatibacter sp.]|jgi:hypothetical protein
MRARSIVLLGIAAYAAFLVATVPARWVAARLALPPGVSLDAVEGTVWNGGGRIAAMGAQADLRWHLVPAALASARLAFAVQAAGDGLDARAVLARTPGGYEAREVAVRADAAQLAAAVPLLAAWRPAGRLSLSAPAIAWDGARARGSARGEWRDASLALAAVRPLGDYRVEARAEGGPAAFTVSTLAGALRIAGHGTFAPPDALAFSGEGRAEPSAAGALEPLLDLLGPRRADGAHAIEWRTVPPANLPRS